MSNTNIACCPSPFDCGGKVTPSDCVQYVGNAYSTLGINQGDKTTLVIQDIASIVANLILGIGIELGASLNLNASTDIKAAMGAQDVNLINTLQVLIANQQTLRNAITAITPSAIVISGTCITPASSSLSDIINAIVNELCTTVTGLSTANTNITSLQNSVAGLQTTVNSIPLTKNGAFAPSDLMAPYVPTPYIGPLTNFDSSGKGIPASGYTNVYIMNGNNGTQDWRGYSPIGANTGVPGATIDSRVDPANANNRGFNLGVSQKAGELYHVLNITEEVPHTHPVTDPGHTHQYFEWNPNNGGGVGGGWATNHTKGQLAQTTQSATSGITLSSVGGGIGHNTVHPVVGCIWIIKLPS